MDCTRAGPEVDWNGTIPVHFQHGSWSTSWDRANEVSGLEVDHLLYTTITIVVSTDTLYRDAGGQEYTREHANKRHSSFYECTD